MNPHDNFNSSIVHRSSQNVNASLTHAFSYALILLIAVKSTQSVLHRRRKRKENKVAGLKDYSAFEALPGPASIPIIGIPVPLLFNRDLLSLGVEMAQKYGPIYKFKFASDTYVMLNSPEFIRTFLSSTDRGHLPKSPYMVKLFPEDINPLIIKEGQDWHHRRRMLNHSFTYRSLKAYNDAFNKHSDMLVSDLGKLFSDGKVHSKSVAKLMTKCIFELSSENLMGVDMSGTEDGQTFVDLAERLMELGTSKIYKPWLMIPWVRKLFQGKEQEEIIHRLTIITDKLISLHQDKLKAEGDIGSTFGDTRETSIDDEDVEGKSRSLIEAMVINGVAPKEIRNEVAVSLSVAMDSTSVTILNTLFLLALHPEHQRKCQEEIDQIFNDESKYSNSYLEYSALPEFKYLEKCISETLRVYPLIVTTRKLESPLKLSEDLTIPAGVSAFPSFPNLNPEYFPDPMKFDPDRFSPEEIKKRHPYAFTPFSMGPRVCLGMKLAMVELKIVIAKILRNFNVSTPDRREDVKMVSQGPFKPKNPINFKMERRTCT